MKTLSFILALAFSALQVHAQYIITTVTGGGTAIPEGVPATSAGLYNSYGICTDAFGNLLIGRTNPPQKIFRINASGTISSWVGNGADLGEGVPIADVKIPRAVYGLCKDNAGNIYYNTDGRVRKIDIVTGLVRTVAGTDTMGHTGDGGPATAANINVRSMALDGSGNLYLLSAWGSVSVLRRVDATTGIINTIAGSPITNGLTGDTGPAADALLQSNKSVAVGPDGSIYIINSNLAGGVIRKIDPSGIIYKLGGDGTSTADGSHISTIRFGNMSGMAIDNSGNIYVADQTFSNEICYIWKIDAATGICRIIAGGGTTEPGDGGTATDAKLIGPGALCVNAEGTILHLLGTPFGNYFRTVKKIYLASAGVSGIPSSHRISIYPNPSSIGMFTLETGIADTHETTVCDALGRRVHHSTSKRTDEAIDLKEQPAGTYYVTVAYGESKWTETVVISK